MHLFLLYCTPWCLTLLVPVHFHWLLYLKAMLPYLRVTLQLLVILECYIALTGSYMYVDLHKGYVALTGSYVAVACYAEGICCLTWKQCCCCWCSPNQETGPSWFSASLGGPSCTPCGWRSGWPDCRLSTLHCWSSLPSSPHSGSATYVTKNQTNW